MLIGCIIDQTGAELINGLEGRNLLSALTAFTEAAVHVPPKAHRKKSKIL